MQLDWHFTIQSKNEHHTQKMKQAYTRQSNANSKRRQINSKRSWIISNVNAF